MHRFISQTHAATLESKRKQQKCPPSVRFTMSQSALRLSNCAIKSMLIRLVLSVACQAPSLNASIHIANSCSNFGIQEKTAKMPSKRSLHYEPKCSALEQLRYQEYAHSARFVGCVSGAKSKCIDSYRKLMQQLWNPRENSKNALQAFASLYEPKCSALEQLRYQEYA